MSVSLPNPHKGFNELFTILWYAEDDTEGWRRRTLLSTETSVPDSLYRCAFSTFAGFLYSATGWSVHHRWTWMHFLRSWLQAIGGANKDHFSTSNLYRETKADSALAQMCMDFQPITSSLRHHSSNSHFIEASQWKIFDRFWHRGLLQTFIITTGWRE
jgi:hypothetical protein